jgi:hypothetical protein
MMVIYSVEEVKHRFGYGASGESPDSSILVIYTLPSNSIQA